MDIKVYVSNLAKYNDGELNGQWTTLPVDDVNKDILDKLELGKDSEGRYLNEWFISDYEAPFKISEYADLYQLNKLTEALEDYDTVKEVFDALDGKESLPIPEVFDFDDDTLNEILVDMEPTEIVRATFFGEMKNWQDDYVYFNGYGNLESITEHEYQEMINKHADDIIKQFEEENIW